MGLQVQFQSKIVEFNTTLALYSPRFQSQKQSEEIAPCSPVKVGESVHFLKSGYRIYILNQLIPLVVTEGNGILSRALGLIEITGVSHFHQCGEMKTAGTYIVRHWFDQPESDRWLKILHDRGGPTITIG